MNRDTLKSLILDLLDGHIAEADLHTLEAELEANESARELYIEYSEIHSLLEQNIPEVPAVSNVVPIERIIRRQKRRTLKIATLSAAAILLIGLVTMQLFLVKEKEPKLTFKIAPGTEFSITHSSTDGDSTIGLVMDEGSRLQLNQGTVELTFSSGVKSIVRAPADLTLHDDHTLFINKGTAWFQVPKGAEGFTVKTRDLNIVDLGTEFGVLAKVDDHDEIHVFKGKVEVAANGLRQTTAVLTTGDACRTDPVGRLDTIALQPSAFLTTLPKSLPYLYWSFNQADGFQASGNHPALGELTTEAKPEHAPPVLVSGKYGTALSLNRNHQHLITNWEGITAGKPRSVAFWVKLPRGVDLTSGPAVLGWGTPSGSAEMWKVQITHDSLNEPPAVRVTYGTEWFHGTKRLDDDQWHHYVAVYSGRTLESGLPDCQVYIDGRKEELQHLKRLAARQPKLDRQTSKRLNTSYPLTIGKRLAQTRGFFQGMIDELYIFEGALTQENIRAMMNTPTPE